MSCLFPKIIKNKRYLPNKKNNYNPPPLTDKRVEYVPISCGHCIECRKKKRREWMVRLSEELRGGENPPLFVTLTIRDEEMKRVKGTENQIATQFVRWFLENIRKKTKKSLKHYLVTELGEEKGRIHLHGFLWANEEIVREKWIYGFIHIGTFVNEKSINYMTKYMLKQSIDKSFIPKVLASKGIGKQYLKRIDVQNNKFREKGTNETYRFRNGTKMYLPQYYRNKIYSEDEKEHLWIEKQEKEEVYIAGEKVNPNNTEEYFNILKFHQDRAKELFGDNPEEWEEMKLKKQRQKLEKYLTKNMRKSVNK